jgi:hypothetical protein
MISTHAKKDFGEKRPNLPVFQEITKKSSENLGVLLVFW